MSFDVCIYLHAFMSLKMRLCEYINTYIHIHINSFIIIIFMQILQYVLLKNQTQKKKHFKKKILTNLPNEGSLLPIFIFISLKANFQ